MIFLGFSGSDTQIEGEQNTISTPICLVSRKINLTTKIQSGLIDVNEIVSKDHLLEKKFSAIIINMPKINF